MERYNFKEIEDKWQKHWEKNNFFKVKKDKNAKNLLPRNVSIPFGKIHMGHVKIILSVMFLLE